MSATLGSVLSSTTYFRPDWTKETTASYADLTSATNLSHMLHNFRSLFLLENVETIPHEQ